MHYDLHMFVSLKSQILHNIYQDHINTVNWGIEAVKMSLSCQEIKAEMIVNTIIIYFNIFPTQELKLYHPNIGIKSLTEKP